MSGKTLAMRVLEGQNVPYRVTTYDAKLRDAVAIAQQIGVAPNRVFKTLVVTRVSGKPFLVMIAADKQLDLKMMARAVGEKKVSMASYQEAEQLTGLQVGGISALVLLNRGFVICADAGIKERQSVYVSAGKRGVQLLVPVDDLIRITGAEIMGLAG
jgi:Cys-tRNA(Pro)/Cys-tRNA(Cys) deacylase